jgi:hypothetical protein
MGVSSGDRPPRASVFDGLRAALQLRNVTNSRRAVALVRVPGERGAQGGAAGEGSPRKAA